MWACRGCRGVGVGVCACGRVHVCTCGRVSLRGCRGVGVGVGACGRMEAVTAYEFIASLKNP